MSAACSNDLHYANLPFYRSRLRTLLLKDCELFLEYGVVARKDHALSDLARAFVELLVGNEGKAETPLFAMQTGVFFAPFPHKVWITTKSKEETL